VAPTSELRRRLVTAVVLMVVLLGVLFWLPSRMVALVLALVALIGVWEWTAMAGITASAHRQLLVGMTALMLPMLYVAPPSVDRNILFLIACLWWVCAAVLVLRYQRGGAEPPAGMGWRSLAGWAMILPAWYALVWLHQHHGAAGVLALLVLIWVADSAAYLVGRRIGRRRLASRVSPGKSWEGLAGALVAVALVAPFVAGWVGLSGAGSWRFVMLAEGVLLVSVLGDLTESLFKRISGLKDSGSLLPGHGGVLDRIDSLLAAAPFFVVGCRWLGGTT
jgi:phosphatidate cytidylyltransferase